MSARYHLRQFKAFVKAQAPEIPEHMMIFDSLNAQKTDDCIEFASELDIESIFLPGGCTDLLQPIDKHIGAWFKQQLKKLWTKFFKKKFEEDPNFEVPDHQKRVLILQWVSEIWQKLKKPEYEEFIRTTFEQPGILIQLDGKNNIKFKDYPEYELNCESIHDGVIVNIKKILKNIRILCLLKYKTILSNFSMCKYCGGGTPQHFMIQVRHLPQRQRR